MEITRSKAAKLSGKTHTERKAKVVSQNGQRSGEAHKIRPTKPMSIREFAALPAEQRGVILEQAAAAMADDYLNNPELTIFTDSLAGDDFVEYAPGSEVGATSGLWSMLVGLRTHRSIHR